MLKIVLLVATLVAYATPSLADDHPDELLYIYAIKNHKGKEPPRSERIRYECLRKGETTAKNCAFVSGPLNKFAFVFTDKYAPTDPANVCSLISADWLRTQPELTEVYRSASNRSDSRECEDATVHRLILLHLQRVQAMQLRDKAAKCNGDFKDLTKDMEDERRSIERDKTSCAKTPVLEAKQRERDRELAKQEAAAFARISKSEPDVKNFAQNLSDGKVTCGAECTVSAIAPEGPYSTITSDKWRD